MNRTYYAGYALMILLILAWYSCSDFEDLNSIERAEEEIVLAVPLINTELNISNFTGDDSLGNFSLNVDDNDRVTFVYNGDVVRRSVNAVFPPVPFFAFPILDTVFNVPVPFASDQRVDKAIFGDTKFSISFTSDFEEDVSVTLTIPQLSKNGEIFHKEYLVPYQGSVPFEYTSELTSLEGWQLESPNNIITIDYDARIADGTRVAFSSAAMAFDLIVFDYIEGYFGSEIFDINGDFIPIGLLDNWISGGLSFVDPKVNIFVENAFGFPVRSIFNEMQVVTTTGEALNMESEIIDNNVDFAYPTLDEIGQVKITEFSFNKDNSNIVELFEEKVSRVTYDIDAGANPDMDESIVGFVNSDSYFLVNVDVELPLEGKVNNLVLQDSLELTLDDLEDVSSAEFKSVIANDFPASISVQCYFYNNGGALLDSLFTERLQLPPAELDPTTERTVGGVDVTTFENFEEERFERLKSVATVAVNVKINTEDASSGPLWIYNDYGIQFKLGAKLSTKF